MGIINIAELIRLRNKIIEERTVQEEDLKQLERIIPIDESLYEESPKLDQENHNMSASASKSIQKVKSNPNIPNWLDRDAGFANAIFLATLSLVFEVLFLALAVFIYR